MSAPGTVFFGPFVGEFGWELLYWQGWVRDLSRSVFRDSRKIVSSFPGRYPFYPDADEYWAHPDWFLSPVISPRGYITDFWRDGWPRGNELKKRWSLLGRPYLESVHVSTATAHNGQGVESRVRTLLDGYRERLPPETTFIVPSAVTLCPKYGRPVGIRIPAEPRDDTDYEVFRVPFECQVLEPIQPTANATRHLEGLIGPSARLITIFPRARSVRRPDKNWPREKYDALIGTLRGRHPDYRLAIAGDPGGAYYADGVPDGCVDLINVEPSMRMDIQTAALRRSVLAVGTISGAMLFALACRCPTLIVGQVNEIETYFRENYLKTPLVYYPFMDADVGEIAALAAGVIAGHIPPPGVHDWDPTRYFGMTAVVKGKVRRLLNL